MVVIVTEYMLFATSQHDIISRFQTNVLAKFVDTTCILSVADPEGTIGRDVYP